MGSLPVKRSNRQNTLPRDTTAIRLRRQRLSPQATVPVIPVLPATDGRGESAEVTADSISGAAHAVDSGEPSGLADDSAGVSTGTDRSLEAAISARIIELRDQLLAQLQSSFAGLRADQEFAWSEQTALLKSLSAEVGGATPSDPARVNSRSPTEQPPATTRQPAARPQPIPEKLTPPESGTKDSLQRWEAIRQNFLETDGADLLQESEHQTTASRTGIAAVENAGSGSAANAQSPLSLAGSSGTWKPVNSDAEFALALPQPIDESLLSDSELREVFRSRERIMAEVIGRYRRRREDLTPLLSAEQLRELEGALPATLASIVASSLQRIDELTRLGEVELAFERASLSRERKLLEQSRFLLEHQARQMGLTLKPDGSLERNDVAASRQKERRWLGKLGFGNQQS